MQFRWLLTNGVFGRESKLESVCLIFVERVVIEDLNVHLPFFQTVGFHYRNAGRNVVFDLPTDETLDPLPNLSKYKVHSRCEAGGMFVERRAGQGCRSCNQWRVKYLDKLLQVMGLLARVLRVRK